MKLYNFHYTLTLIIFLGLFSNLKAQMIPEEIKKIRLNQVQFGDPIDLPFKLAGNFGELRHNHFHTGIDIKTNGKEGHELLSVQDGFISRVKVSAYGYGNTVYIQHNNGYTSVYAHMSRFTPKVEEYVRKVQYSKQTWAVNLYPPKDLFKVTKGQIIGYSGNSGRSMGPHLHFEIRETKGERPINPLQFYKHKVKDIQKPIIQNVWIYPVYGKISGRINGKTTPFIIGKNNSLKGYGKIGIGLQGFDRQNELNKNGIYEIIVKCNNELIYHHRMDKISFSEFRGINHFVDYERRIKYKNWVQQFFMEGNNNFYFIKSQKDRGFIDIKVGETYNFEIEVKDFHGNHTDYRFTIQGFGSLVDDAADIIKDFAKKVSWNESQSFYSDNLNVYFPKGSLYHDIDFVFKDYGNNTFKIHNEYTPINKGKKIVVTAKPDSTLTQFLDKIVFAKKDKLGKWDSYGGKKVDSKVQTKLYEFGTYSLKVDSIPPNIKILKKSNIYSRKYSVFIQLDDNLSGIGSYDCYLDGKWILVSTDSKNKLRLKLAKENVSIGKHTLKIKVKDEVGNESVIDYKFTVTS